MMAMVALSLPANAQKDENKRIQNTGKAAQAMCSRRWEISGPAVGAIRGRPL
jgi:hypothetical protein